FQAEDGIRDRNVTGVQTCALPILFGERWLLHFLRQAAITAPVEGYRAAAVRDHEFERREILEEIALNQLHERGRVAIDVMRAGKIGRASCREREWIAGVEGWSVEE